MDPLLEGTTDAGVAGRSRSLEKRLPVNAGTFGNFATRALGEKSSPLAVLCPLDVERVDVRAEEKRLSFLWNDSTSAERDGFSLLVALLHLLNLGDLKVHNSLKHAFFYDKCSTIEAAPSGARRLFVGISDQPLGCASMVLTLFVGTGTSNILEGPVVGTGLRTAGPTLFDLAPPRLE